MKRWDAFWVSFNGLFDKLPGAIEDAIEGGVDGATVSQVSNGHIVLRGKFKSLKINGFTVRIPRHVLDGK
jgi:hypothetical protein